MLAQPTQFSSIVGINVGTMLRITLGKRLLNMMYYNRPSLAYYNELLWAGIKTHMSANYGHNMMGGPTSCVEYHINEPRHNKSYKLASTTIENYQPAHLCGLICLY